MMVALEPIRQAFGLERIIVSTYQAVSGAVSVQLMSQKNKPKIFRGKPVSEWSAEILPVAVTKTLSNCF